MQESKRVDTNTTQELGDPEAKEVVYGFTRRYGGLLKIGCTAKANWIDRIYQQSSVMDPVIVHFIYRTTNCGRLEPAVHKRFRHKRAGSREWFNVHPVEVMSAIGEIDEEVNTLDPERLAREEAERRRKAEEEAAALARQAKLRAGQQQRENATALE